MADSRWGGGVHMGSNTEARRPRCGTSWWGSSGCRVVDDADVVVGEAGEVVDELVDPPVGGVHDAD